MISQRIVTHLNQQKSKIIALPSRCYGASPQIANSNRLLWSSNTKNKQSNNLQQNALIHQHEIRLRDDSSFLIHRQFSSEATKENTINDTEEALATSETTNSTETASSSASGSATTEEWIPEQFTRDRSQSILITTFPDGNYTAGQAWYTVQKQICQHETNQQIRHSDYVDICNSTQSQSPKDAKLIARILKDLKSYNKFILSKENARVGVEAMYRSLLPRGSTTIHDDNVKGYFKVQCGLLIGQSFVEKETGMYVALDTDCVNEFVLEPLYYGLKDLQQNLMDHVDDDNDVKSEEEIVAHENDDANEANAESGDESNDNDNEEEDEEVSKNDKYLQKANDLLSKSMNVSKQILDTLLTRASNPTRDMKKRAKRKYLTYLRCSSGPSPTTIDLLVKICLLEVHQRKFNGDFDTNNSGNSNEDEGGERSSDDDNDEEKMDGLAMAKAIVQEFEAKQYLGVALPDTHALIQETEDMLMKASLVEETAAEEEERENAESSGDEKENEDDANEEGNEEEKK